MAGPGAAFADRDAHFGLSAERAGNIVPLPAMSQILLQKTCQVLQRKRMLQTSEFLKNSEVSFCCFNAAT